MYVKEENNEAKKEFDCGNRSDSYCCHCFRRVQHLSLPGNVQGLSDNSLNDSQVEAVKDEILSGFSVKVLVAYFSYSGTTKNIANAISEKTGGDLFEIAPQNGYSNVYMESNSEIRSGKRPTLTETVENIDEYDIVFVGYPVWWHATPAPVNSFLESHNLSGKLIIPSCTINGWREMYGKDALSFRENSILDLLH